MKTVRELYRKLNDNNEIPEIEGQGNFTADQMIWFAEQAVKLIQKPNESLPKSCPVCWNPLESGIVKNMCTNDDCPTNLM